MTSFSLDLEDMDKLLEEAMSDPKKLASDRDSVQPPVMLGWSAKDKDELMLWLDEWILELELSFSSKKAQWVAEEAVYRALDEGPQTEPFIGASGHNVPLAAMAVDPIVARLDTGIFKASPVFKFKGLRADTVQYIDALEQWVEYYQRHRMRLRRTLVPRLIELAKHGTMVLKVVYDIVQEPTLGYDKDWNVVEKTRTTFSGPQIFGVGLGNFMFPAQYQNVQECPIVVERQSLTWDQLIIAQQSGTVHDIDSIKLQVTSKRSNELEDAQSASANHLDTGISQRYYEVFEIWCDYVKNGKVLKLCVIYHKDSRTILSLRLNKYFHQRKPYVVIPYSVATGSMYGIGIVEMVQSFQDILTKWDRAAFHNAYLANIRMFIAKKDANIEAKPKLYSGRVFRVDDPAKDFIPFNAAADTYNSTLSERQNVIGLAEKRTGVSDYLTGRESPIVGSRATATSTVALIAEGTKRVEETLENLRSGLSEAQELCIYNWIQFGLGEIKDIVFGSDDISQKLQEFFDSVDMDNINGALSIDLAVSDAANNRALQQQAQLAIIQVMMNYFQKVIEAGQLAVSSVQTTPQVTALVGDVMVSARQMFKELLSRYDIRNSEEYLPDITEFLAGLEPGGAGGAEGNSPIASRSPGIRDPLSAGGSVEGQLPPPAMQGGQLNGGSQAPGINSGL